MYFLPVRIGVNTVHGRDALEDAYATDSHELHFEESEIMNMPHCLMTQFNDQRGYLSPED